ncbi:MAG: Gfo/Idh/MocA family oxidoreductase [Chloroflexota bacterium]
MTFKIAIIGCGARGVAHARDWQSVPNTKILAVSDTDQERAQALGNELDAQVYTDWQAAIQHGGIHIVSQCVPSFLHADVTSFAAKQEKHVFGEKPLALTLEQGQQIVDVVAETGVVFMPCFQYRDRWYYQQYREAYVEGKLGSPVTFRFSMMMEVRPKVAMHKKSMNGGPMIDMACHLVDLLRWITEEEPETVFAAGQVFGQGKPHLSGVDDLAIDEASVIVTFSGGHKLDLYLNWGMPTGFTGVMSNQLIGPDALLQINRTGVTWQDHQSTETRTPPENYQEPGMTIRMQKFVKSIQTGQPADITSENGLAALRVSWAALQSIESGRVVQLN